MTALDQEKTKVRITKTEADCQFSMLNGEGNFHLIFWENDLLTDQMHIGTVSVSMRPLFHLIYYIPKTAAVQARCSLPHLLVFQVFEELVSGEMAAHWRYISMFGSAF